MPADPFAALATALAPLHTDTVSIGGIEYPCCPGIHTQEEDYESPGRRSRSSIALEIARPRFAGPLPTVRAAALYHGATYSIRHVEADSAFVRLRLSTVSTAVP